MRWAESVTGSVTGILAVLLLTVAFPALAQAPTDAAAEFARGLALSDDEGSDRDLAAAADAFYRAAVLGHAEAAHRLGLMYARGEGVSQDDVLAYVWLARAAAAMPEGEARTVAIANRSVVAARLTPEQIAQVEAMRRGSAPQATVPSPPPAVTGWRGVPAAAAPEPEGGYRVQLGAFRKEAQAQRALQDAAQHHADLLKGLRLAIRHADRGALGSFYRVQAGPLAAAGAERICEALRARGAACLVVTR